MRRRLAALCLSVLVPLAAVGCAEPAPDEARFIWAQQASCPANAPAVPLPALLSDSLGPRPDPVDVEEIRAYIARTTPGGWGGFYYAAGGLTLLMTNPDYADVLLDTLHYYGIQRPADARNLRVELARWDFHQLDEWVRYFRLTFSPAYRFPGEVSPTNNRIEVTTQTANEREVLLDRLAALGAPCWLVAVNADPAPAPQASLTGPAAR